MGYIALLDQLLLDLEALRSLDVLEVHTTKVGVMAFTMALIL
jgi:hypothetical protein